MKKIILLLAPILFLMSCNNSDDHEELEKEIPLNYYFGISSVIGQENDDEATVEIEIDGIKHKGRAPFTYSYRKISAIKETHIKVNINSRRKTGIIYQLRKNVLFNGIYETDPGKWVAGGNFVDKLDTIIKIK